MPPAGQPATGAPPLAVSRTAAVQCRVQLTIEIAGTSVLADAPANVSVKPLLPAPADVDGAGEARDRVDRGRDVARC